MQQTTTQLGWEVIMHAVMRKETNNKLPNELLQNGFQEHGMVGIARKQTLP